MANFNFNKVILGGRLAVKPELKTTPSGVFVTMFTVAVSRKYVPKDTSGNAGQPQADFIRVVAWRQIAEFICKYFDKGSSICIVGSIQTRTYTDKQGSKQYATEVVAEEANFVDAKGDGGTARPDADTSATKDGVVIPNYYTPEGGNPVPRFEELVSDEELPF